jgi:hypothetical protein
MRQFLISRGGRWRLGLLVFSVVALALGSAGGASAAKLTVCQSGCQYTTIAAALAAASNGDPIAVGPGTYDGGFTISVSVRLVGAGQNVTTISGGNSVVTIDSAATVAISRVTISGGSADRGGGIDNQGILTLSKSTVSGNVTGSTFFAGEGGGIFNDLGRLTLVSSTVSGNTASTGGGIRNLGGTVVLIKSRISGNAGVPTSAGHEEGSGGGIANGGTITLVNTAVLGNTSFSDAPEAGGIVNEPGGVARLINSRVQGNTAETPIGGASGGGIANLDA